MAKFIEAIVRLIRAGQKAYARKWSFLGIFLFAFLASVITLAKFDLLPSTSPLEARASSAQDSVGILPLTGRATTAVELPMKIEIPKIGLSVTIENPTVTAIDVLDRGLLKGAVRYSTSAKLGEAGNVVLFGHSSYLPIVGNQAYKTFNGIQKLVAGDTITVYSSDAAYTYRVRSFVKESANDAGIPMNVSGRVLTLSTCDSFGAKTDRFVVTADFVESHAISG